MRKLGVLLPLIAVAALMAVWLAHDAAPTQATGTGPTVSLTIDQKGKPVDACPSGKNVKCTLNVGDSATVTWLMNDAKGLTSHDGDPVPDWHGYTARLIGPPGFTNDPTGKAAGSTNDTFHNSTTPNAATCLAPGSFNQSLAQPTTSVVECKGTKTDFPGAGTVLATSNITCVNPGSDTLTLSVAFLDKPSVTLPKQTASLDVHCGETATIGLRLKGNPPVRLGETFVVSIVLKEFQIKDADGDGAGYNAWQARVNWDADLKLVGAPAFLLPKGGICAHNIAASTALLGCSVGVTNGVPNNEETQPGNLVELTFRVNATGPKNVELKSGADTFLLSEKTHGGDLGNIKGSALTINTPKVTVDPEPGGSMSLEQKTSVPPKRVTDGNKHLFNGDKMLVSVTLDDFFNFVDNDSSANGAGYTGVRARVRAEGVVTNSSSMKIQKTTLTPFEIANCQTPKGVVQDADVGNGRLVNLECTLRTDISSGESQLVPQRLFEVGFVCNATGTQDGKFTISVNLTQVRDEKNVWQNVTGPSNTIGIRCVGGDVDKDGDSCTTAEEAAITAALNLNPPLNPNQPDWPDVNHTSGSIDIGDVYLYVADFGGKPFSVIDLVGPTPSDPKDNVIDIQDIFRVVKLFGQHCP